VAPILSFPKKDDDAPEPSAGPPKRWLWQGASALAAIAAGALARAGLQRAWIATQQTDPPDNPADPSTRWRDALVWSVAIGAGMGVARVIGRRAAAAGWTAALDEAPPGLEQGVG
jgi:hypothetical protein